MTRHIVRLLVVLAAIAAMSLALTVHTAGADPFYCDGVGPTTDQAGVRLLGSVLAAVGVADAQACGSTGVCYWEYLGNGLWLEHCYHYCEIYRC